MLLVKGDKNSDLKQNAKYCFCCLLIVISWSFGSMRLNAQTETDLRQWAGEVAEMYAADTEQEDLSFLIEDLLDLVRDPLNLNTADREELERIFFLSDLQIEHILFKRYVNGPFHSIFELQAVEGLSMTTIRQMEPLVWLGPEEPVIRPFRVWGDLFVRSELILEKAAGYIGDGEEPAAFKGDRFRHYLRAEAQTSRQWSAGFIAEKDPGEPMFGSHISGVDLMTGYLRYEEPRGILREAVAGQFSMSAGQGLVVQSGMPARKSSMATTIRNRGPGFRPSLSASEYGGLRGGYLTLAKGAFELTPFFSVKQQSGRLQTDSAGNVWLTSLRKDGLFRTETELSQRHNVTEQVGGAKITYKSRRFTLDAGHLFYHLSEPLMPDSQAYNQFYFRGRENQNSWFSYVYTPRNLLLFGEVALNDLEHPAFWNGLVCEVAPGMALALGHRLFPLRYNAPLAGPLSESSSFAGESGFYVGIEWQLPGRMEVSSYLDRYRFEWLKYGIDAPSGGFDWLLQVQRSFSGGQKLLVRYRYREKPVNQMEEGLENSLARQIHNQIKAQYRYNLTGKWQLTSLAEWHFVGEEEVNHRGLLLAQDLRLVTLQEKLTLTCRYALFDTDDYSARIYAYEPDVLYKFLVPAYSGKGSRYLLLINYKMTPALHFWLRAARWVYDGRNEIGTGYNRIEGNTKTEVRFQIRKKF